MVRQLHEHSAQHLIRLDRPREEKLLRHLADHGDLLDLLLAEIGQNLSDRANADRTVDRRRLLQLRIDIRQERDRVYLIALRTRRTRARSGQMPDAREQTQFFHRFLPYSSS